MYCSTSIKEHLARGALAFAAIGIAIAALPLAWPALILGPLAIYLMRGCPMCWLAGLIATIGRNKSVQQHPPSK